MDLGKGRALVLPKALMPPERGRAEATKVWRELTRYIGLFDKAQNLRSGVSLQVQVTNPE